MKRVTAILCVLYTVAALALLHCASVSYQHGSNAYCAVFSCCSILFGLAIVHHAYHRDELRAALVRLDRAARPHGLTEEQVSTDLAQGWRQLNEACCLRSWESAGAKHDAQNCTRKDTAA